MVEGEWVGCRAMQTIQDLTGGITGFPSAGKGPFLPASTEITEAIESHFRNLLIYPFLYRYCGLYDVCVHTSHGTCILSSILWDREWNSGRQA